MKKEYLFVCSYYERGEVFVKYAKRTFSLEYAQYLYEKETKKQSRKKRRKRCMCEIYERTDSDWLNRDQDNIFGLDLSYFTSRL